MAVTWNLLVVGWSILVVVHGQPTDITTTDNVTLTTPTPTNATIGNVNLTTVITTTIRPHLHPSVFCDANQGTGDDERYCEIQDDDVLWFFLSLFVIIVWGAFVRTMLRVTGLNLPYTVVLMITGLILGSGTHIEAAGVCPFWSKFTKIARIPPKNILFTFLPGLIFESAYNMDVHVFTRSLSQIIVIALPGVIISVFLTGFVCHGFLTYNWDYPTSFMYGAIISATDPVAVVAILKQLGTSVKLRTLIEAESLLNDGMAVLMYEIFRRIISQYDYIILELVITVAKFVVGGPLFGYTMGRMCTGALSLIFNDAATEITITIFASYFVYATAQQLGLSGVISVTVLGLTVNTNSTSISPEVQKSVREFWVMVGYLANTVVFVLVGIILSETALGQLSGLDWFNLVFLYINLNVLRLSIFMVLMPWLTRIGYGLKWQDMVVSMYGGLRGAVSLCLALEVFYSSELCVKPGDTIGPKILFLTGGIVFLTLSVNGTTTKPLLDALNLTEISSGRQQDMNNAMKQVLATKDRAALHFRHDPSVADADWHVVHRNTRLHNPYKARQPKKLVDQSALMGKKGRGTVLTTASSMSGILALMERRSGSIATAYDFFKDVPVQSEVPEDDSDEDSLSNQSGTIGDLELERLKVETEEARQRVIKALKVSLWHQYEKGILSAPAVHILTGVADRTGDHNLHMIHAKDFNQYYKVHGFFHWFQKNVVERFELDKPVVLPALPEARWRQRLWWLATREWFNWLMVIIVVTSLIPTIWEYIHEVTGHGGESPGEVAFIDLAFIITSLAFTLIYLLEFLIKIFGLGCAGYFGDKWNWIDLGILIFGVINFAFSLAHIFSVVGETENNVTTFLSLVTRTFRVAKLVRSFRLLKCCVRHGQGFLDRRMNYSIFLGYDIGSGFVSAVDDVLKFLPQMSEYFIVVRQLARALKTERLETIRMLGLLQQKYPTITIAVKTRHVCRAILNGMRETLYDMREDGILDVNENVVLLGIIESKMKGLWDMPVTVTPNSRQAILRNVVWLHAGDDVKLTRYIKENATLVEFEEGDTIISFDSEPNGIYLIVKGMVKAQFSPTFEIIRDQFHFGKLPNTEVLGDLTFRTTEIDYLQVGTVLGEIGVLTNFPCASTVTCETPVTVYHIPQQAMLRALKSFAVPGDELESRMWRSVGMRVAESLLPDEPEYQSWTVERVRERVEHSVVPIGSKFHNMTIPDYVCDVVLLQGEIQDGNTKESYMAQRVLPKSCRKLQQVNSTWETRFLVVADIEAEDEGEDDWHVEDHDQFSFNSDDKDNIFRSTTGSDAGASFIHSVIHEPVVRASKIVIDPPLYHHQGNTSTRQRALLKKLNMNMNMHK